MSSDRCLAHVERGLNYIIEAKNEIPQSILDEIAKRIEVVDLCVQNMTYLNSFTYCISSNRYTTHHFSEK